MNKPKLTMDLERRRMRVVEEDRTDEWRIDRVRKASKAYGRAWSVIFLDAARAIARCRMSPVAGQCLWWAIGNMHPRDWTLIRHQDVGRDLGLTRSAVTKGFGELRARGLIAAGERGSYRLTLFVGWQGTAGAYQKAKRTGRAAEIDAGRKWHRAHAEGEERRNDFWRVSDDGESRSAPRERRRAAERGGEAKGIGDLIPNFDRRRGSRGGRGRGEGGEER